MDLRRLLRQLIAVEISLAVVAVALAVLDEYFLLPPPLRAWLAQQSERFRAADLILLLLGLPLLIAMVVSWVGLWRLWGPARWLYLITFVGGLVLEAVAGPWIYSGPSAAVDSALMANTGVILALIFLTPLAAAFERPPAAPARGGFDVNMPQQPDRPDAGDGA